MGTIRNEMVIVHHWSRGELEKVREDAIKAFISIASKDYNNFDIDDANLMISPIMSTYVNGEYTFVINGDCSRFGHEISGRFHEARMKWCEKHKQDVQNIIVINFGEGDEPCRIAFDSTKRGLI